MTIAPVLSLIGIAFLAAGTPRQAHLIDKRLTLRMRVALRASGIAALTIALIALMTGTDRARECAFLIGAMTIEALVIALIFSLLAQQRLGRRG